jgi:hypothetical protein
VDAVLKGFSMVGEKIAVFLSLKDVFSQGGWKPRIFMQ